MGWASLQERIPQLVVPVPGDRIQSRICAHRCLCEQKIQYPKTAFPFRKIGTMDEVEAP